MVDVDWRVEHDQPEYQFEVDKEKAMRYGISPAQVVTTVNAALSGQNAGVLHQAYSFNTVNIKLQLNDADKSGIEDIKNIKLISQQGNAVPIGDLITLPRGSKKKRFTAKIKGSCLRNSRYGRKTGKPILCHEQNFRQVKNNQKPTRAV